MWQGLDSKVENLVAQQRLSSPCQWSLALHQQQIVAYQESKWELALHWWKIQKQVAYPLQLNML